MWAVKLLLICPSCSTPVVCRPHFSGSAQMAPCAERSHASATCFCAANCSLDRAAHPETTSMALRGTLPSSAMEGLEASQH